MEQWKKEAKDAFTVCLISYIFRNLIETKKFEDMDRAQMKFLKDILAKLTQVQIDNMRLQLLVFYLIIINE